VFIIICIVVAVVILALAIVLIYKWLALRKTTKLIETSEITLSDEESKKFNSYFGIEKPEYLTVLACAEKSKENESYFAVKAVILDKNIDDLITEIGATEGVELYEHKFTRTPVMVDFDQGLPWWSINEGRLVLSYHLKYDSHISGSSAITIVRVDGINYVYLWYTDPAMVSK